jgi:hypothetical protein
VGIQQALSFASNIRKGAIEQICNSIESEICEALVKGWVFMLVLILVLILAASFLSSALAVTQCSCVLKW